MMRKSLLLIFVSIALIFTSCKKDKTDQNDPFSAEYNDATVAENKATLEDNGINMVQEMQDLKDLTVIDIAENMATIADSSEVEIFGEAVTSLTLPLQLLAKLSKNADVKTVSNALKSVAAEPENFTEAWAEIVGTYVFNFTTGDFDVTEGGSSVIIQFPGLETDNTNTAQITINDFNYMTITNNEFGEDYNGFGGQMLTSLHMDLTYEGTTLVTFDVSASYQSNGMPTSLIVDLVIEEFSFNWTLSHTPYSNASGTFSFKHNTQLILQMHGEANGNWSEANIEEQVNDAEETVYFENIINNSNAYIQLMDVKVAAMVDSKGLVTRLREIWDMETITDQQEAELTAEAINQYTKLVVLAVSENKLISKAEAYAYENDENSEWDIDIRFVFADGSKTDAETYFNTGFSDMFDDLNELIAELNEEYDTEIEPIDY